MTEPALHRALGLTDGEYERIRTLLARDPNDFELAVFSLLWSEHCGYKHSALLLKRLPRAGSACCRGRVRTPACSTSATASPSPSRSRATTTPRRSSRSRARRRASAGSSATSSRWARGPVALLDGLRFAEPDWHFSRAVGGIGHYGNCVGVPTVGGEAVFDEAYRDNCLVNAMCVGLLPVERLMRAKATVAGQLVVLYGATTGRDGIGGASVLASQELDDGSAEKRPSVQVGDPFTGKKLIEASVELVSSGLVESLQDCGAAGIASSLSEMAADFGIDVHLDRVPLREEGMEPWEVMISESQERMIAIVRPQMLEAVEVVLDRWELEHAVIGEVTATGELRAFWGDEVVGEIPARLLTDECPRYEVAQTRRPATPQREIVGAPPAAEALVELLASPALRSRAFVFRRYDQLVGSRTVRRPGLDAAVLRLRPSMRGLAALARRPRADRAARSRSRAARSRCSRRPETSRASAASRSASPTASTSATRRSPRSAGSSRRRSTASRPRARRSACRSSPGNVSLYNETNGRAIHPTPVVGAVGLVEDVRRVPKGWREGDVIFAAFASAPSLAGSEYQARYGEVGGTPAPLDLDAEARLVSFLWQAAPLATLVARRRRGRAGRRASPRRRSSPAAAPRSISATTRSSSSARSAAGRSSRAPRTRRTRSRPLRPS